MKQTKSRGNGRLTGWLIALLVIAGLGAVVFRDATLVVAQPQLPPTAGFRVAPLDIVTREGVRHPFRVEIAETEAQKAQGLMFRRSLAADAGMLFLYPQPQVIGMWMRNTFIPLDMLFMANDGTVLHIHEGAVPHDETTISSELPAMAVLEVAAGTVKRLGLQPGDRLFHPAFGTQPKPR